MSLFPAYSEESSSKININENNEESTSRLNDSLWLTNDSYYSVSLCLNSCIKNQFCSSSSDDETNVSVEENQKKTINVEKNISIKSINRFKTKRKQSDDKQKKFFRQYETHVKNIYFEDKDRNKRFSTLETLEKGVRPHYKLLSKSFDINRKRSHNHLQRYYMTNIDISKKTFKKERSVEEKWKTEIIKKSTSAAQHFKVGDEQKNLIDKFNKKLLDNPKDINTWIEYVNLQDEIVQIESFHLDKEIIKQLRNKKKLSIIEKALKENRDSTELFKSKLYIMSELLPADQFVNEIEEMIQKDKKNIILLETLITVVRTSCTLFKVSKLFNLYLEVLSVFKKNSKADPKFYDKQILELLHQFCTFLRHAGNWEQLWEIIRTNICLNLALPNEVLQNIKSIDEQTLMRMENIILNSELPLNQLWLRIESLRESCHWTSINVNETDINLIGDEKRLVSSNEIIDFIYPTISRDSNFRLIILSLYCLKVPLLPSRHCTLKDFNLDQNLWNIDSLEFILPMIYPTIWTGELSNYFNNETVITDLLEGKLISGPQFLRFHPAQESYLDFIRLIFTQVAQNLPSIQRTSILIWWLRFERLLIFIANKDSLMETNKNKKVQLLIKKFLKKPENRNNLYFYKEFALIERELGSCDNCVKILKTIIDSQEIGSLDEESRRALFSLYRTMFEILLDSDTSLYETIFQEVNLTFQNFVSVCFNYDYAISIEEMLYNEILKFLMSPIVDELEDNFLLPNIYCDILTCYAYLLYIKNKDIENIHDILELFDRCLSHCIECFHLKERFYETKIIFLQFCINKGTKITKNNLPEILSKALEEYPNNFFLLSMNALIESELPHWKVKTFNRKYNAWSTFSKCLVGRARITYLKNIGFEEASKAMINKMLSLHRVASKMKDTQECPLIWKFYMLLLREYNLCQKKGEDIYYAAVAQCPWDRSIYVSSAEIAPHILSEIQDLIKEKELRMHVMPEELEILRA